MAIGTAAAIGLGISAASAGASFAQAVKQNKVRREAEAQADMAMQEAEKLLEKNFYESLSIQKEPYELEREALRAAGAQAIQAGVESERGAAATVGRVAMAQNEAQAGVRTAMGKEMMDLEKMTAQEDSRLRDVGVQLKLGEVEGAQQAAADAQRAQAAAISQGAQSIQSAGQQVIAGADLYAKTGSTNQLNKMEKDYNSAVAKGGLKPEFYDAQGKALPFQQAVSQIGANSAYGFDVAGIGSMSTSAFQDYMTQQSVKNLRQMRGFDYFAPAIK